MRYRALAASLLLLVGLTGGCVKVPGQRVRLEADVEAFAVTVAMHIVASNYEEARRLFTPALQERLSSQELEQWSKSVFTFNGNRAGLEVFISNALKPGQLPDRGPNDAGWAYVAVNWPGESQAVIVTIVRTHAGLQVKQLELGRP